MTNPHGIDRTAAEALGYRTMTAAEFELAEFIRWVTGDPDHLHRPPPPAREGVPDTARHIARARAYARGCG